ncbi:carbohydrate binding domain-containing protein [Streptomyces sp. NPDC048611]|uniref:carbohydrate binding domain-containing protein n=1 Tax=Streptomyces sp. NPDC048611 TaxID=3155635 RepID=UPI0034194D80
MTRVPKYEIYIDWDNDGGLDFGNFELGTDSWTVDTAAGTTTAAASTTRAHLGDQCLLITWNNVSNPKVIKTMTGLISGRTYSFSAWVWVPAGDAAVRLGGTGLTSGSPSTVNDAWQEISVTFTASGPTQVLNINVNGTPTNGDLAYVDQVMVTGAGEDVSGRLLGVRDGLEFGYGRDQARSLSAIKPGETSFTLDNRSRDYTPDNTSSPLYGYVRPGRPTLIRATFESHAYDLFRGYLDDFTLNPAPEERSLTVSALDVLQKLADATVSTPLYESLQTGEAIAVVLDAIGWPADRRDIDPGATTCRWWWEEGTNALDAVNKLADSEGPPAFAYVSEGGNFVFRSRHHRFIRDASTTSQGTFRGDGTEPVFSAPMSYDIGWRDIVNDITLSVPEREPEEYQTVWSSEDVIALSTGEVREVKVETSDPFINAAIPSVNVDYQLVSGAASMSISRSSGQSLSIFITCTSAATIKNLSFRAVPVTVARTYQVNVQDQTSISEHGVHSLDNLNLEWAGVHDARAIAATILGLRSERLPIVEFDVVNANTYRTTHILNRGLSDRIHIVETETGLDHDFFIEQVKHTINDVGYDHRATFGCERVQVQNSNPFTFGVAGKGFDAGTFTIDGFTEDGSLFILGTSLLGQGLLGY